MTPPINLGILSASGSAVASAVELISTTTLSSSSSGMDFRNIPQTYRHLWVLFAPNSSISVNPDQLGIRFNNDSSSVYGDASIYSANNNMNLDSRSNQSRIIIPNMFTAFSNRTMMSFTISDYTESSTDHSMVGLFGSFTTQYSQDGSTIGGGTYDKIGAVNRIDIDALGWTFEIGSKFSLFGIGG